MTSLFESFLTVVDVRMIFIAIGELEVFAANSITSTSRFGKSSFCDGTQEQIVNGITGESLFDCIYSFLGKRSVYYD